MTNELDGVAEEAVTFDDPLDDLLTAGAAGEPDDELDSALAEARADVTAGRVISHAAMKRWLLSWGTAAELPPPECDGG